MRTLKKTLSIVLVLALCLSLCAVGANAMNFADQEKIGDPYYVAVGVMTGMGILEGQDETEDGVLFVPQGSLTRAAAAKIASYILLGKAAADELVAAEKPFADVDVTYWGAGYIAYAKDIGIVSGTEENADGSVNYTPEATLTGPQFTKILLGAIGYGKNAEYDGEGWANKAINQGLSLGLYTGDLAMRTADPLTREQAMLMTYNAMTRTDMVAYNSALKIYEIINDGKTLAEKYYDYDGDVTEEPVQVTKVEYDEDMDALVATAGAFTFLVDSRLAVGHIFDIYSSNAAYAAADAPLTGKVVYFADCLSASAEYDKTVTDYVKATPCYGVENYVIDNGSTIENINTFCNAIVAAKGAAELIGLVTYDKEVVAVQSLKYDLVKVTVAYDEDDKTVTSATGAGDYATFYSYDKSTKKVTTAADVTVVGADFAAYTEDTVEYFKVLKVADTAMTYYELEKLEPVTGTISRVNGTKYTVDGVVYEAAAPASACSGTFSSDVVAIGDKVTMILDLKGDYLQIKEFVEEGETPDYGDYSLVYVAGYQTDKTFSGKFEADGTQIFTYTYSAQLAFANGTFGVYEIASIDDKAVLAPEAYDALQADTTKTPAEKAAAIDGGAGIGGGVEDNGYYDAMVLNINSWALGKIVDGKVMLRSDETDSEAYTAAATSSKKTQGITADDIILDAGKYISGTVFIYVKDATKADFEVKYVNGAHAATAEETNVTYSYVMNKHVDGTIDTVAAAVAIAEYTEEETVVTELEDLYYVASYDGQVSATTYEYTAYNVATGAKSVLTLTNDALTGYMGSDNKLITITATTADGVTTYAKNEDIDLTAGTLAATPYFTLGGKEYINTASPDLVLDSKVVFVNLDPDSTITKASELGAGDTIKTYDPTEAAPVAGIVVIFLTNDASADVVS